MEEENAFLKKAAAYFAKQPKRSTQRMKEHEGRFAVRLMCRVLSVSASGYYDWRKRGVSNQAPARTAWLAR